MSARSRILVKGRARKTEMPAPLVSARLRVCGWPSDERLPFDGSAAVSVLLTDFSVTRHLHLYVHRQIFHGYSTDSLCNLVNKALKDRRRHFV